MPYYVVPMDGKVRDHLNGTAHPYLRTAKEEAEKLKKKTGKQYNVISVTLEATTQTIEDMLGKV